MDFLAKVKQGLAQLEEQARLLEAQAEPGEHPLELASPFPESGKPEVADLHQRRRQPATGERVETPSGPSRQAPPTRQAPARRLVDDLHGRLDEAFLLSEILGPPRSVRGWDDD